MRCQLVKPHLQDQPACYARRSKEKTDVMAFCQLHGGQGVHWLVPAVHENVYNRDVVPRLTAGLAAIQGAAFDQTLGKVQASFQQPGSYI